MLDYSPRHSTKDTLVQGALFRNIRFKIRKCPQRIDVFSTLADFAEGRSGAYIVSTLAGKDATGSATVGVAGCPAGFINPLTLFSGNYALKLQRIPNFTVEPFGIAGLLTASTGVDPGGNPAGLLAITATSSVGLGGSIARLEGDVDRYQINDDCSGGTLIFNLSSRPAQYEFYFRAGFQSFDVISQVGPSAFGEVSR